MRVIRETMTFKCIGCGEEKIVRKTRKNMTRKFCDDSCRLNYLHAHFDFRAWNDWRTGKKFPRSKYLEDPIVQNQLKRANEVLSK